MLEYIPSFLHDEEEETLIEAVWAIAFYLEKPYEKNEHIKNIVFMNITGRLVDMLDTENPTLLRPLLRTMCHLSYGSSESINSFYTNRIVQRLTHILHSGYARFRNESAWAISNFILTSEKIANDFFVDDLVLRIIDIAYSDNHSTCRQEALGVIIAFLCTKSSRIIDELVFHYKVIDMAVALLKTDETDIVLKSLDILDKILQYGACMGEGRNEAASYIYSNFDMGIFVELQKKSSQDVYEKVSNILKDYFNDLIA